MLTININSIKNDRETFKTNFAGSAINPPDEKLFEDRVDVDIQIYRTGEQVVVKGLAETKGTLSCARCLVDYKQPIKATLFFIVRQDHPQDVPDGDHGEDDDEMGIVICHGDQLELMPEIRSSLLLALPLKPLCGDQCRGLCINCGADLNSETCQCSQQNTTTPFAALKDIIKTNQTE